MGYQEIDLETWPRKEHYLHFTQQAKCFVSITKDVDVTQLRAAAKTCSRSFYIAFLYVICKVINRHGEFKLAYLPEEEKLAQWERSSPPIWFSTKRTRPLPASGPDGSRTLKRSTAGARKISRRARSTEANGIMHGEPVPDEFRPLMTGQAARAAIATADAATRSLREDRKVKISEITV